MSTEQGGYFKCISNFNMINFFIKKSPLLKNLSLDMHNHILPGIDDGAVDIEESEKIITGAHTECVF